MQEPIGVEDRAQWLPQRIRQAFMCDSKARCATH